MVQGQKILPLRSAQFEMECTIEPSSSSVAGIRLALGKDSYFEMGYDAVQQLFYIDRAKAGDRSFNEAFKKLNRFEKKISLQDKKIFLHIYFDNSIAEIFVNDGAAVFTAQLFPPKNNDSIALFTTGAPVKFSNLNLWAMRSIW
jgi:sucrose-6-phosphate hydrolase SacC (GH32 family)